MKKIFVAGGVSYDALVRLSVLPDPRPHTVFSKGFREAVGSTGTGKALALKKLGMDVSFHAFLGNDRYGDEVRAVFARAGVETHFEVDPSGTERHVNLMDENGRRISIFATYATFEPELDLDRIEPLIAGADLVVLNIINYCRRLIPIAKKHGKPIWTDLHDWDGENGYHKDFARAADAVFLSSDSLRDFQFLMFDLIRQGKQFVVATHGGEGSTLLDRSDRFTTTRAIDAGAVRDINGAGDNFFAGFLWAHAQGRPLAECAEIASVAGGLCVTSDEIAPEDLSPERLEEEWRKHFPRR